MSGPIVVGLSNSPFISVPGTYKLTLIDKSVFAMLCIDEQGALRPHAVRHRGTVAHLSALLGRELPPAVQALPALESGERIIGLRPVQGQAARGVEQGAEAQYEYYILARM